MSDLVNEIRNQIVFSDWVRRDIRLSKRGHEWLGLCPFHQEKSPSFTVDDQKGLFYCFGCGESGDIFDYLMKKWKCSFQDCIAKSAQLLGLKTDHEEYSKTKAPLSNLLKEAQAWFSKNLQDSKKAKTYCHERGLTLESIQHFGIGWGMAGLKEAMRQKGYSLSLLKEAGLVSDKGYDFFQERLIFPITNNQGGVIGFGGRTLDSARQPKYLNSPESPLFQKKKVLYGYSHALASPRQNSSFIVVEGYLDVITLHQNGIQEAVAPLGTALTEEHLKLLWRFGSPILCFDGDNAGRKAAYRAIESSLPLLRSDRSLYFCWLPKGEDPDSFVRCYGPKAFNELCEKKEPLINVLWSFLVEQNSVLEIPEQKANFRKSIRDLVERIQDPDVRTFYQQDLWERQKKLLTPKISYAPNTPSKGFNPLKKPFESGTKILLVTLINHPILLEETIELLPQIYFEDPIEKELVKFFLDFEQVPPREDLKKRFNIGRWLEDPVVYILAPFAHENKTFKEVLEGWMNVWKKIFYDQQKILELRAKVDLPRKKNNYDEWERIKALKKI